MSLTLTFERCEHDNWHAHNALRLADGTVVDDPGVDCKGGSVVFGDKRWLIGYWVARFLTELEEIHREGLVVEEDAKLPRVAGQVEEDA